MASPLDSLIKTEVKKAFKGRLKSCTLRRVASSSLDSKGNPVPGTATTYACNGFRDQLSAYFAAQAGVPVTDVRILIIAESLSVTPVEDDQIKVGSTWFQLRQKLAQDPADATYEYAAFEIPDPT